MFQQATMATRSFLRRFHKFPALVELLFKPKPFNFLVWALLAAYFLPIGFMIVTAMMPTSQLSDRNAPLYPAQLVTYRYQNKEYPLYTVPTADGPKEWALVKPHLKTAEFVDPQDPAKGVFIWTGNWRYLPGVYAFSPTWENFTILFRTLPFAAMLGKTLFFTLLGEIGVLASSIVVAYGFSRFRLPGGNLLFYVLIATILIPEKITLIPSYFFFVNFLNWKGTIYPILLPFFFGNAVYIFLLRQNFKSIPIDLEEAAMLDGAGPLRRLFLVILPQSWPVVITVSLLHFFYMWNETRLASLYLGSNPALMPVSFGIQVYQSRLPIQNVIQAGTLVVMVVPVLILLISQRFFMQGVIVTGAEK
jgi:multiple sugar transport system permease protein